MAALLALAGSAAPIRTRALAWDDLPADIQRRLTSAAVDSATFARFRQEHDRRTEARVREGDLDALVYFALQSAAFTKAPPIEPALSARAFVEAMDPVTRTRFLSGGSAVVAGVPAAARARLTALVPALGRAAPRTRLAYFRDILAREKPADPAAFLLQQYVRAMQFLYQKEFVAQRAGSAEAVAALYQQRGLSTDTAVEAGYLVHIGLATLHALEPDRRIRRVLIVGPGLDLAPRTALIEAGSPESYQPYAAIDSLLSLGLAQIDDLVVVGADVNPRVVDHLETAGTGEVSLTLVTGIGDTPTVSLQQDYREYFERLGRSIGVAAREPALPARYEGHLRKTLRVRPDVTGTLRGVLLDIATARIEEPGFDLVIATNVLPYLDDTLLTMALTNLAAALAPGGVLLHNEGRALVREVTREIGLPLQQARTAVIATVRGAAPLSDAVWIHEKRR